MTRKLLVVRPRFARVMTMILLDVVQSKLLNVVSTDPSILLVHAFIPYPINIVPELHLEPAVKFRVENCLDFILGFPINFDWRRRTLGAIWEWIRIVRLKLGHMEYWVD